MDRLKKAIQKYQELLKQLRAAADEENPDPAKVDNLEKEIRAALQTVETEKAIAASGIDPEKRYSETEAKPEDLANRAISDYIRRGASSPELRDLTSANTPNGGGYLIPQEWERNILEREREIFVMRSIADVQSSALNRVIPVAVEHGESAWIAEAAEYPASDPEFGQKNMEAHKVGRICKVSEELLQDNAYNLEQWLADSFGYTNGLAMEQAYISGDGAGKPRGFLTDADAVSAAGNTVTYDSLLSLFAALKTGYFTRAVWLMNKNTLVAIMKLKDTAGAYLYKPFNEPASNGPIGSILSKNVVLSDLMPDVGGDKKPIALGDFKYYRILDREGFQIQRLNERYADFGMIGFRGWQRTDGKLLISEAVKALAF